MLLGNLRKKNGYFSQVFKLPKNTELLKNAVLFIPQKLKSVINNISLTILSNLKWSFLINGWWYLPEEYVSKAVIYTALGISTFAFILYVITHNIIASAFTALLIFAITTSAILAFPIIKALNIIRNAEGEFIYFLMTLYTASTASRDIIAVMKLVAESTQYMGRLLRIAIRDSEVLGIPFNRALRELAKEIPSPKISTFFQSLAESIESRGDITGFVRNTFNLSLSDLESKLAKKTQSAGALIELYINMVLLMPLIVITMGLALSPLSGGVFLGFSLRDISILVIVFAAVVSAILTLSSGD